MDTRRVSGKVEGSFPAARFASARSDQGRLQGRVRLRTELKREIRGWKRLSRIIYFRGFPDFLLSYRSVQCVTWRQRRRCGSRLGGKFRAFAKREKRKRKKKKKRGKMSPFNSTSEGFSENMGRRIVALNPCPTVCRNFRTNFHDKYLSTLRSQVRDTCRARTSFPPRCGNRFYAVLDAHTRAGCFNKQ